MAAFNYRFAVVRGIPDSFKTMCIRSESDTDIDLEKAREQHDKYIDTLTSLGLKIVNVQHNEGYPDCVFVEDTAIVVDNTALICRLGAKSRAGEEVVVRRHLREQPLNLDVVDITDPDATIEGGDVMFTGTEILVGLSARTNQQGAAALARVFHKYPVTALPMPEGLHLKSVMSMISSDTIAISNTVCGRQMKEEIIRKAKFTYDFYELEEDVASNVLFINGTVVHQTKNNAPKSWPALEGFSKHPRIALDSSELSKADGCLSCCSILIP